MEVMRFAIKESAAKIAVARLCLRGETVVPETEKDSVATLWTAEEAKFK